MHGIDYIRRVSFEGVICHVHKVFFITIKNVISINACDINRNWKFHLNWLVLDIMVLGLGSRLLTSTWQYNNCSRIHPILYWCNPHHSVK